jgi:hypothetical protein
MWQTYARLGCVWIGADGMPMSIMSADTNSGACLQHNDGTVATARWAKARCELSSLIFAAGVSLGGRSTLRPCSRGPRPPHPVLLRGYAVVVASAVSGVLLRSDDGELPAQTRPCLRELVGSASRDSLRQPSQCISAHSLPARRQA